MAGEDPLAAYRAKRDFDVTSEPAGAAPAPGGNRFVVQRHRATRLHYDLRLEMGGVFASWAVPKGPTLDPGVRHLAVHVEDHPVEYADFEGVIPSGEYGGGDVIVWDRGTWEPAKTTDPLRAVTRGELHFDLSGEKLAGRFVLHRSREDQWIIVHKRDGHAVPGWSPEEHPRSVKSGRTNAEVAEDPDAMWRGDQPADRAEIPLGPRGHWTPVTPAELAALDALGDTGRWHVGGRDVRLTGLDKVLFGGPEPVTKRDFVRYHAVMATAMLPYLAGRPVNLHRYPDGVDGKSFWQKAVPAGAPDWLTRWRDPAPKPGRTGEYAVIDGTAALVWAAAHAAIELHPWNGRLPDPRRPSWAFVDIDPGERTSFADTLLLARLFRDALAHLGVAGAPKVTGARGVQIWIPVRPGLAFEETREWVRKVSVVVADTAPGLVSWAWEIAERDGLARLDYTQNARGKTLIAPFSARPAHGAPVSMPITWDALDDPGLPSRRSRSAPGTSGPARSAPGPARRRIRPRPGR
ncbi:ATP-dependent DNA ligase [Actinorhabdospora filicis]|uniref:ATP-dependent DNA ligase n=1 Tax=Actinorhabdospora filicis TaxID=1785913 RepID=A0A9W6STI1_9ACTN|nr:DNA polymerase ligase N-terminal domain-containing protein [Actinorhabdospora filicis]GLZ81557.1 ATP-dependent DNA ligase [Actinorhabdospora filicis]